MPPLNICPRCQRTNPAQALYCHYDGNLLRVDAAAPPAPGGLSQDYIFPSKRRCHSLDDFVQGCQYEWEEARDLLKRGEFARYFNSINRGDLARAAKEAEAQTDPDVGLHRFLGTLPVTQLQGPKLDINPRRLVLKDVKPGEFHILPMKVLNIGKGLLQGRITVTEGEQWLRLDADNPRQMTMKTAREEDVILHVDTRGLAAPQTYSARLTIVTNGGIAEVPIRLDLGVTPFPHAPFKGATTQRELAIKMKKNPRAAVSLLAKGEVQKWFTANGWDYPVLSVPARGVAVVQQFFEGMGLTPPPQLQLSETEIHCFALPPEVIQRQVTLWTSEKKWVYGQADTDVYWLKILTPNVAAAQQAAITFEVDSSLMVEGQVHEAWIQITGNAGQRLAVRVVVDVHKQKRGLFGSFFKMVLFALLYRLLFLFPGDLYARVVATGVSEPPPGTLSRWAVPAASEDGYLRLVALATWWVGALVGACLVWRQRSRWTDGLAGTVAGAMGGTAAAVTAGCLVTLGDGMPRALASALASPASSGVAGTVVWIFLVILWWAALGALAGFILASLGKRGRKMLDAFCLPGLWLLGRLGLGGAVRLLNGPQPIRKAIPAPASAWSAPVITTGGVTRKG